MDNSLLFFLHYVYITGVLINPETDKEGTSSEARQRRARFQQYREASCHQFILFPARQGAEGNSRHFDRNGSLFPSWSG